MIQIATATPLDAPAIQKLLRETWQDTYGSYLSQNTLDEVYKNWQSLEFLIKQIENSAMHFPVAKEAGQVVGTATAHKPDDTVMLFRLYVSPQAQRKGVGTALLQEVMQHFKDAKKIHLHVEVLNQKGQAFYQKHGFKELKRESEKVVDTVIEEILMEKLVKISS